MSRPPGSALAIAALALGAAACSTCPPEARRLVLSPDFSTPETAARSFLAAVGCGEDVAAYKCLSEGLKREHGATLDGFLLFKSELEEEYGSALGYAFRLQPLGTPEFRGEHTLQWWGLDGRPLIGMEMEPQYYLDFYTRAHPTLADGDFLAAAPGSIMHRDGNHLTLDLPQGLAERLPDPSELLRVDCGTEWKVRDILSPPQP